MTADTSGRNSSSPWGQIETFVGPRDSVIFVDDWKGTGARSSDPVFYLGRAFDLRMPIEFEAMHDMLRRAGAAEWHVTDRRGWFNSPAYREVFDLLDMQRTEVFTSLEDRGRLMTPRLTAELGSIGPIPEEWPR